MLAQVRLTFALARRFRAGRERSGFLSFISASSTLGIALGCAAFIAGLSVMNGFADVLQQRFLSLIPQVELRAVNGTLQQPQQLIEQALAHPQVRAAQPVIRSQAMIQQGARFTALQVNGIALEQPQAIADYMPATAWQALQQPNSIVLGSGLAKLLDLTVNDTITVLVADQQSFRQPQRKVMTVAGVFHFGGTVDHYMGYTSLANARELLGMDTGVTAIDVQIRDIFESGQVATAIGRQSSEYLYLDHWMRSHGHLYRDILLVRLIMYVVLVLVLAVACFNIVSTLIMTVQEKLRHIGILRTMGLRRAHMMQVFVWQGLQNGAFGVLLGVCGGMLLTISIPQLLGWLQQLTGSSVLAGDVYFVDSIPARLAWQDVLLVALAALVMSMIATLYPAWRAGTIEVIEALE
ncbi:lipoprotein-releasing ABC transporter permease subunit [Pseudidiomarina mangrovi]|uniref:lipoprotein-releasing ABC transporter permease subunit n=1 Tax=Pseudidiomarina mangrovi TaxID=2487133 RepID=UPI001F0CB223|nr:lipoprotein-releasing ABC transporter permease subunit [Pseudidiomarina mangrovi]